MTKRTIDPWFGNKVLDITIYLSIFLLFIVPLLIPYSYFPTTKYLTEILVLVLGGVFALLVVYRVDRISIAHVSIAAVLLAIMTLAQIGVLNIRFPGINIVVALEFVVVFFVCMGVTSLIDGDEERQKSLTTVLAFAVLVSTTIQALYGLFQFTGIAEEMRSFIMYAGSDGNNVFGNIGQKNDYVDFIGIGVFALSYLYFIGRFSLLVYVPYVIFYGCILTLTTSRTPFTFFICALIISFLFMWCNRHVENRRMENRRVLLMVVGMFIGLFVLEAFLPKIIALLSSRGDVSSGLDRFGADQIQQSTYRRFYEWYKDLVLFTQHPLFGVGWYQYPKAAIDIMLSDSRFMYIPANSALYTHSHNSPLNMLAETGIIGFVLSFGYGVGYALYRMFRNFNNYATLFLSFMILTVFAQGFLQYPLWYAYFLVYFAFFLAFDKPKFSIKNSPLIKGICSLLFLSLLYFGAVNTVTYFQVVSLAPVPQDSDDFASNAAQLEDLVDHNIIWSLPALLALDNYLLPTMPQTNAVMSIQEQERYVDMLGNELPYPGIIFKQIIMHKINGDNAGSLHYANLLAHGFPYFKDQFATQISNSPIFADEVAAINGFKYEDRSIFAKALSKKDTQ